MQQPTNPIIQPDETTYDFHTPAFPYREPLFQPPRTEEQPPKLFQPQPHIDSITQPDETTDDNTPAYPEKDLPFLPPSKEESPPNPPPQQPSTNPLDPTTNNFDFGKTKDAPSKPTSHYSPISPEKKSKQRLIFRGPNEPDNLTPEPYNKSNNSDTIKSRNMDDHLHTLPPVGDFSDYQKGQRALTMLLQLPSFSGSPVTRFDRWIKLFENVVAMSNWNEEEKVNMLITKMTDKAHDILQNIMESYTENYDEIKHILHERFHGNETEDFYQKKFDSVERKPQETILDYAFRLKTIFQRAYPAKKGDSEEEEATRLQFLRLKFLQGLEPSLRNKIRHKPIKNFEELVAETQKYSIRMDADKDEKDKREFVNAVSNPCRPTDSPEIKQLVAAIEKQNDTVNAIASNLKNSNRPTEMPENNKPEANDHLQKLTEAMVNFLNSTAQNQNSQRKHYDKPTQNNFPYTNRPNAPNRSFRSAQNSQNRPNFSGNYQPNRYQSQNRPNFQPNFTNFPSNQHRPTTFSSQQTNPRPALPVLICNYCGFRGHTQENCRKLQHNMLESGKPPICYNCRGIGHMSRDCSAPPNQNRPNIPGPQQTQGNA